MDPHQAIAAVRSMEAVLEASEGQRGSILLCLELFAGAGWTLVMVGIYGVMAYSVSRRGPGRQAINFGQSRPLAKLRLCFGRIAIFYPCLRWEWGNRLVPRRDPGAT